jgi:hypothetical protein
VRKAGLRVRIAAQLIDAATDAHLWADHFDGSLEDVSELQDKVALSIAGVIEPRLQAAEIRRSTERPAKDLTTYDLYLHALSDYPTCDRTALFGGSLRWSRRLRVNHATLPPWLWQLLIVWSSKTTTGPMIPKQIALWPSNFRGGLSPPAVTIRVTSGARPWRSDASARKLTRRSHWLTVRSRSIRAWLTAGT